MNLSSLQAALDAHPDAAVDFQLPDQSTVPAHFHVTEVGRVRKDFIDCGGTIRSGERCVLQVWVAEDRDHRVTAAKLAKILRAGRAILRGDDLDVEVEYDVGVITQMPVEAIDATDGRILVQLGGKHTACLAADRCGVADSSCAAPGCCAARGGAGGAGSAAMSKRVVFVCVENSNRSQMAEAFARIHGAGKLDAYSAGSRPSGKVNPKAVVAMRDVGYDLALHKSKSLVDLPKIDWDYAITMGCGDECPNLRAAHRQDWSIPDPKHLDPAEFAKVRDLIEEKVKELLGKL